MIILENLFGKVTHSLFFAETNVDRHVIVHLEELLPRATASELQKIPIGPAYQLVVSGLVHERDEGTFHAYGKKVFPNGGANAHK